jgi:hypothetical protein
VAVPSSGGGPAMIVWLAAKSLLSNVTASFLLPSAAT